MVRLVSHSTEAKLIEMLKDIEVEADAWTAIAFNFNYLGEHNKNDHQSKIAVNMLKDLLPNYEAVLHLFDDSTLYVVVQAIEPPLIDKMIFQLRYLFMDDGLAYTEDDVENPDFAYVYHLGAQWEDFQDLAQRRLQAVLKRRGRREIIRTGDKSEIQKLQILTASKLGAVENDLAHADLSRIVRRQPVCASVQGASEVRPVFEEMYINIAHLQKMLGLKVDLLSNKWLFKYLTEILDERMLTMLQRSPARFLEHPVSLNLNVKTLLSQQFMEFDTMIKPSVKVTLVIELQMADVFTDMEAFLAACETAQSLGYRVCLDGVTQDGFALVNRKRLGVDLVKILWNADSVENVSKERHAEMQEVVNNAGRSRIILTRCDTQEALDYGYSLGIGLYQGRFLDALLNPQATIRN